MKHLCVYVDVTHICMHAICAMPLLYGR